MFNIPEFDFSALSSRQRQTLHELHVGIPVRHVEAIDSLIRKKMLIISKDGVLCIAPAAHPEYKKWILKNPR